jgi:hypothetical protein
MSILVFVLWSLGEIDQAVSLVEGMNARIADLTHANTLAQGALHASMFELMRGDRSRARTSALELARSCANTIYACSARTGSFSRAG